MLCSKKMCSCIFTGLKEDQSQTGVIAGSISDVVIVAVVTIALIVIMFRYFIK